MAMFNSVRSFSPSLCFVLLAGVEVGRARRALLAAPSKDAGADGRDRRSESRLQAGAFVVVFSRLLRLLTRPAGHVRRLSKPRGSSRVESGGVGNITGRDGSGRVGRFLNLAGRDGLPGLYLTSGNPCVFFFFSFPFVPRCAWKPFWEQIWLNRFNLRVLASGRSAPRTLVSIYFIRYFLNRLFCLTFAVLLCMAFLAPPLPCQLTSVYGGNLILVFWVSRVRPSL